METLIIKIQDNYLKAKDAFDNVNDFAAQTVLSELTMEDIISEIKMYRNEKNEQK